ncbi:hypothetical protein ND748_17290 [Frankia sp. AiPs1]|uniref:hypothetical protein n=1 Tax=Frankia sp. AiPs1 TaxID=573493 RepID=UPI00204335CA|nr:hypothetical protein [Frankia sp. AiPs1]MCM3923408.1 hypothetical protein [Frankia sp. AiPs1]
MAEPAEPAAHQPASAVPPVPAGSGSADPPATARGPRPGSLDRPGRARSRLAGVASAVVVGLLVVAVNLLPRLAGDLPHVGLPAIDLPEVELPDWFRGTFDALRPVRIALLGLFVLAAAFGEYSRHRRSSNSPGPDGDDLGDGNAER